MIYHYYYKRLQLFRIPYKILLAYQTPIGNTIKIWSSFHMNSFILAKRNDINILNITYTIIQIRKALNTLFNKIRFRGSFTLYAQAFKALKMNHESVFSFITAWVPGLLTNYRRVTKVIKAYKYHIAKAVYILKRPQLNALVHVNIKPLPRASFKRRRRRIPHIPKFPVISLSILDSDVWLNECANLGIPSIQICDTQSQFGKVTYPIISNQRSIAFSHLIVHLAAEVCNTSLLASHLDFISFYKYHGHKSFPAKLPSNRIIPRRVITLSKTERVKVYFNRDSKVQEALSRYVSIKLASYASHFIQRLHYKRPKISAPSVDQLDIEYEKPLINNERTYIVNNRSFSYQIKDLINTDITSPSSIQKHDKNLLHHHVCKSILWLKECYNRLVWLLNTSNKRKFYRKFGNIFKAIQLSYHHIIVRSIGLREALSRKRKEKRRFLTMISFNEQDTKGLFVSNSTGRLDPYLSHEEESSNQQMIEELEKELEELEEEETDSKPIQLSNKLYRKVIEQMIEELRKKK